MIVLSKFVFLCFKLKLKVEKILYILGKGVSTSAVKREVC